MPTSIVRPSRRICVNRVEFLFQTTVTGFEVETGRVVAVRILKTRLMADRYVVAAGSYSTSLLWGAGIKLPVRPAKGYSVTVRPSGELHVPGIPIIDDHHHAAIVPLDGRIRVAGAAEFAGYDLSLQQSRISSLLKLLADVLPRTTFDPATAQPWCALRAMSVDVVPIIGATWMPNLFVNTGHGHLGWTMAAGSAQLLSDLMSRNTPTIDPAQYDLKRFR